MYEFELPFPPSVNGYWRSFRGRQIISKRGREYRESVIGEIGGLANEKVSFRISLYIEFYPPDKRKRDLDNYLKAALDGITHSGFWIDDEQIDRITIVRKNKVKDGMLKIKVGQINGN